MRYWYIDSANFVTLMLIDKGYYDYDFEEPKHKKQSALTKAKSDAETAKMLSRFGVGTAARSESATDAGSAERDLRKMDMEQLQAYAMADAGSAERASESGE